MDVKLYPMIFIYCLVLKTLTLVCVHVCALAQSYVFTCVSVPVHHLEIADKFCPKNYFNNPTHTISKLRLMEILSQKKLEK